MVVAMARNGTDFGIQVAGTGDEWFTGPAQLADGLFLGDYGPDDANPDIGDSAITETAGIGGFAMATAPAIVRLRRRLGARRARHHPADARDHARREPALDGAGAGVPGHARPASTSPRCAAPGSCRRSTPAWPASVAGVGQVGAGLVTPPAEIFPKALPAGRADAQRHPRRLPVRCDGSARRSPERQPDVDVARGPQRRALLEVGLPRLVLVARRQRAVGAHHPPPRHAGRRATPSRADQPRTAAAGTAPTTSAIAPYVVTRPRGTASTQRSTSSTYSSWSRLIAAPPGLARGQRDRGRDGGDQAGGQRRRTQMPGWLRLAAQQPAPAPRRPGYAEQHQRAAAHPQPHQRRGRPASRRGRTTPSTRGDVGRPAARRPRPATDRVQRRRRARPPTRPARRASPRRRPATRAAPRTPAASADDPRPATHHGGQWPAGPAAARPRPGRAGSAPAAPAGCGAARRPRRRRRFIGPPPGAGRRAGPAGAARRRWCRARATARPGSRARPGAAARCVRSRLRIRQASAATLRVGALRRPPGVRRRAACRRPAPGTPRRVSVAATAPIDSAQHRRQHAPRPCRR